MAKEIRLPDIGNFKDVPIIEILVAPGQTVRKDETILTLESDKASMDVPAPEDGVIGEIRVNVGDKVTQGDVLATYSGAAEQTKQGSELQTPKDTPAVDSPKRRSGDPAASAKSHGAGRVRRQSRPLI